MHGKWLVLHGDVLAWVILFFFLSGSCAISAVMLRFRAWRAGRIRRQAFERAASGRFEAGEIVTLKGYLELGGAACASFEDGRSVAISAVRGRSRAAMVRGEHLVLRGAETVSLDGPLDILVGSIQSARSIRRGKLKLATAERVSLVLEVGPKEPLWFASLVHGDSIWVQGRLRQRSPEATAEWRLVAEADVMPVLYAGVPRVTGGGWWRIPVAVMASLVLYFGLAKLAYASGAYELAAATPYRTLALQRLRDRYSNAAENDGNAVAALELVQRLRGDFCHLESRLRELGYLERAARISSKCDDPAQRDALALCLMRQGSFADASALLDQTSKMRGQLYPGVDLAVNVHLLADQPARALARLEVLSRLDPVAGVSTEVANETKARTECLRLALRSKLEHDPDALAALRKRIESPLAQYSCTVLYADLVQGEERLRALESCAACRTKHTISALPWLLGVQAACARGQEESSRCVEWLLEAKPAMRHPQWNYAQPLPWVAYVIPAVESEVSDFLVNTPHRSQQVTDAWTWVRDRLVVFSAVAQPSGMQNLSPLLDELARARDERRPLDESSRVRLRVVLAELAVDHAATSDDTPTLRRVVFETGTCYHPRGWYERELEPRRTLASLLWTAQNIGSNDPPELAGQLWITARALTNALNQRDVAVALIALHH